MGLDPVSLAIAGGSALVSGVQAADAKGTQDKNNAKVLADALNAEKKRKKESQHMTELAAAYNRISSLQGGALGHRGTMYASKTGLSGAA